MDTQWKWIPGYENHYQVSNHGEVRRWLRRYKRWGPAWRGRVLFGYNIVALYKYGSGRNHRVSRLVMAAFVGPCPEGMVVCHNNGDRSDNRLENLRYDTPKNNTLDMREHGTAPIGERHPQAKLTEDQVHEIRTRYAKGGVRQVDLAAEFGVTQSHISSIVLRDAWKEA
jgi:hypothetical protein